MTRSTHKGTPRRIAFNKFVRQKAHQEGILFKTALAKTIAPAGIKAVLSSSEHGVRHRPGRTGTEWNSGAFICAPDVDDGELSVREEDIYDLKIDFMDTPDTRHYTDMKVSLLDIARPAKPKGAAKDFEVVRKVRNVVALEDEFEALGYEWEDDEWEQIHNKQDAEEQRSYSSVLRRNDSGT